MSDWAWSVSMLVLAPLAALAAGLLARAAQRQCAVTVHWRGLVFGAALFWFWYLAPAALESRALGQVFHLLQPGP